MARATLGSFITPVSAEEHCQIVETHVREHQVEGRSEGAAQATRLGNASPPESCQELAVANSAVRSTVVMT